MGMKMSNVMVSLVILGVLVGLLNTFHTGIVDEYDLTTTGTIDGLNPIQELNQLSLIVGFEQFTAAIYEITSPTASTFDILGGLASAGIGFLKIITGIVTFPLQILGIYVRFLALPEIVNTGIGAIILIYVGFILIRNYTQQEN